MTREELFRFVSETYGTEPEYLWLTDPDFAVLRHAAGGKWYGIVMDLRRRQLGLPGEEKVDVLNLKLDPALVLILCGQPGFLPAYHMNKTHWISVLLDGSAPDERIRELTKLSYEKTKPAMKRAKNS